MSQNETSSNQASNLQRQAAEKAAKMTENLEALALMLRGRVNCVWCKCWPNRCAAGHKPVPARCSKSTFM
jgi:hypothetical protein